MKPQECPPLCTLPPDGWECSRPKGHDGPCAATPILGEHGESSLEVILAALPKFHPAKRLYSELCMKLAEAQEDTARLQALQDHGADWDIYAEAAGKWSLRERSGERSIFNSVQDLADALISSEKNPQLRA